MCIYIYSTSITCPVLARGSRGDLNRWDNIAQAERHSRQALQQTHHSLRRKVLQGTPFGKIKLANQKLRHVI